MIVVAVLIEGDQHICNITCVENLSGTQVDLVDGGATRDGGGDGHVGHDLPSGPPGQTTEHSSNALDPILGISSQTDHNIPQSVVLRCLGRGAY